MNDRDSSTSSGLPAASPDVRTERTLWEGSPSGWQLLGWWISLLLVITLPIVWWKWLVQKNTRIRLTNQRLRLQSGVFSKQHEDIELYRVKDWIVTEPFWQRLLGCGTIAMVTSDRTAPEVTLEWLPEVTGFADSLRQAVEAVRDRKRVREVDFGEDGPTESGL
ncbi:MAG: PH domain-containing protein [Verrucomicrobiales bacterium]